MGRRRKEQKEKKDAQSRKEGSDDRPDREVIYKKVTTPFGHCASIRLIEIVVARLLGCGSPPSKARI